MEEDDVTPHILVCTSRAQKLAGLLGGFSGLPAPLFSGAAYACAREPFRRRLTIFILLTLSSA